MSRFTLRYAVLALALMLSMSAFAKTKYSEVTLYHDATVNGTNLPAGDYKVKYDVDGTTAQVTFLKYGKQVATASGEVKTLTSKPSASQVKLDLTGNSRKITEIDFGGQTTGVNFAPESGATGK